MRCTRVRRGSGSSCAGCVPDTLSSRRPFPLTHQWSIEGRAVRGGRQAGSHSGRGAWRVRTGGSQNTGGEQEKEDVG